MSSIWASALAALAFGLLIPREALATTIPFALTQNISPVAFDASATLSADVDGDGDLDVVVAEGTGGSISWFENTDGHATAWTQHPIAAAGPATVSIATADMDGDGDLDVVAAFEELDTVVVYDQAGSPESWALNFVAFDPCPTSLFIADIDRDGDPDILTSNSCLDSIGWYPNAGGLFFAPQVNISSGIANARSVFAADIDGDGDLDAIGVSDFLGPFEWQENVSGTGGVWNSRSIGFASGFPNRGAAADLDGDGDLDVLTSSFLDDRLQWYRNLDGAGNFGAETLIATAAGGGFSVADLDGDGDLDVLHASQLSNVIAWEENNGTPTPAWTTRALGPSGNGLSVTAGDLDGDGDLDVLSASSIDYTVSWLENRTIHRSAAFPARSPLPSTLPGPWSVRAADLNGDGHLDVVSAAGSNPPKLAWFENDGASPPGWVSQRTISTNASGVRSVDTADVDGDGDIDVLTASEFSMGNRIAWYENLGGSPPAWTERVVSSVPVGPRSVFAADVDGDGDMDVLSASFDDNTIAWYQNSGARPPSWTRRVISTTASGARSVFATDLDLDGDVDVLSASEVTGSNKVAWYENNGASPPSWTERVITTTANVPQSVFAADIDGDGDPDVLVASSQDSTIAWYQNNGASPPAWTMRTISTTAAFALSATAADLDGDGDLDVLSASFNDDKVSWYENNGAALPAWTERVVTTAADGAASAIAADVDRDGRLDIVSCSRNDNHVDWYRDRGGQFALGTTAVPPVANFPGGPIPDLRIIVTHRGRPGDSNMELATLELLFEHTPGDPLTSAQANALIESLQIYVDDGDGLFGNQDSLARLVESLSLVNGRQTVTIDDGDLGFRVSVGSPRTYFITLSMATNGGSQPANDFRVTHITESSSTAEDAAADIPLSLEFVSNVSSAPLGFPPKVTSVVPQDNTLNAPTGTNVTVVFSEPVNPATVTSSTFRLLDALGTPVPASVALAPDGRTATLDPTPPGGALALNMLYTVDVTSGVIDLGSIGAVPFTSRFATAVAPVGGTPLPTVADQSVLPSPSPGPGGLMASPLASSLGPNLGYSVSGAGDLNHDQLGDFVGGAPGYSPTDLPEAGAVAIYMGSNAPDPPSGNSAREITEIIYTGQAAHERAGSAVASGFDFNGDGTGDILIGAEQINRTVDPPQVVGAGKVYLIYFKPQEYDFNGNSIPDYQERSEVFVPLSLVGTGISGAVFNGVTAGDQAGYAVAAGGFLESSDTRDDVVIGAPGSNANNGKVYVLFSSPSLTGARSLGEVGSTLPGTVYVGSLGERLGSSVALPGDVTAPVGPDIAMGAPLADTTQADAGRVYIAAGGNLANGTVNATSIATRLDGDQACEETGFAVAGGGDNRASGTPQLAGGDPDLLVGAPYFDAVSSPGNPCLDTTPIPNVGRVLQTTGRLPNTTIGASQVGSSVEGITWRGVQAGGGLGWAIGRLGDLSGNRLDDIGLSAPFVNPGTSGAGAVYVIEGSANVGMLGSINADQVGQIVSGGIFLGTQTGEEAGLALCAAGDLDGDGLAGSPTAADFTVGSPGWNASLGTVHQVLGTLLQQPGECTALGCTVADLSTGAVLTVPPGALASGVTYRFAVAGQASLPTACGSHSVSGKSLVGSSSNARTDCGTPPCTPPGFAIGPDIQVPTQQNLEYQLSQGEQLALRYCDSTLGWRTPSSGPTTGVLQNNSYLAGRKAAASNGVDSLRLYGVFFDDADHDDVRDTCDCSPGSAAIWSAPGPAGDMTLSGQGASTTILTWALPDCPGGAAGTLLYDTIRSLTPSNFMTNAVCIEANGTDLTSADAANPPLGLGFFYIVSPENGCAAGSACQLPACVQTPARDC